MSSLPRIDAQAMPHVAHPLASSGFASTARPVSFGRDTLEVQEGHKEKEKEVTKVVEERTVATKENSSFLSWVCSPFTFLGNCAVSLWNFITCQSAKKEEAATEEVAAKNADSKKETVKAEKTKTDDARDVRVKPKDAWQRKALGKEETELNALWNDLPHRQKTSRSDLGWKIRQEDIANHNAAHPDDARPSLARANFKMKDYITSLDEARSAHFQKRVAEREEALRLIGDFTSHFRPVVLADKNRRAQDNAIEKAYDKFTKLSDKKRGNEAQMLMAQAAFVMQGGRLSTHTVGDKITAKLGVTSEGRFMWADENEPLTSLSPLGAVQLDAFKRIHQNNGFLLPSTKDRQAIADFMESIGEKRRLYNEVRPHDLQTVYKAMEKASPQAAKLLAQVVANFYGNGTDGKALITQAERGLDIEVVIHCANVIDHYENQAILLGGARLNAYMSSARVERSAIVALAERIDRNDRRRAEAEEQMRVAAALRAAAHGGRTRPASPRAPASPRV